MAPRSPCPLNGLLEIVGDKWTLLILRDLMFRGKSRFGEFQTSGEGIATNILSARLAMLEAEGLIAKRPDDQDRRRQKYLLTERGISLMPVLLEMTLWGERHLPGTHAVPGLQDRIASDREGTIAEAQARLRNQT